MKLAILLLWGLFTLCKAELPLECNILGSKSPVLRLRRHLFCEYDSTIRPVTSKDKTVNVSISISPKFMDFEDHTSTFILHSWIFIDWTDEHLTWKPDDFDGVKKIRVNSEEIWVPDFSVYNSGNLESSSTGLPRTMCQVTFTGKVTCVPSFKYTAQCETDYTYWPYDVQECIIRTGSWSHTGEEISFNFGRKSLNMKTFKPHKEWLISNYTARKNNPKFSCCPNDTFPTLILTFSLQRHSQMIHAVFITPAVVLMIMTCAVMWLDSKSVERISLAAVNFICHLLCIYNLHWIVPSNGINPPLILLYYRDSLILASFAMMITTFLRKLQTTKVSAPSWILSIMAFVENNQIGRFFFIENANNKEFRNSERDSVEENVDAPVKNQSETWRKFAIIMERLSFYAVVFTYVILILCLLPIFHSDSEE